MTFVNFSAESHSKNSEEIFRIAFGPDHPLVSKSKRMQLEIQYKKQFCIKDEFVASCNKKQQHWPQPWPLYWKVPKLAKLHIFRSMQSSLKQNKVLFLILPDIVQYYLYALKWVFFNFTIRRLKHSFSKNFFDSLKFHHCLSSVLFSYIAPPCGPHPTKVDRIASKDSVRVVWFYKRFRELFNSVNHISYLVWKSVW